jgi:hypothetical protein
MLAKHFAIRILTPAEAVAMVREKIQERDDFNRQVARVSAANYQIGPTATSVAANRTVACDNRQLASALSPSRLITALTPGVMLRVPSAIAELACAQSKSCVQRIRRLVQQFDLARPRFRIQERYFRQ